MPLLLILDFGLWNNISAQTTAQAEKMLSIVLQQNVDFTDVYLAEKFSLWQKSQRITAFTVDKRLQKTNHDEIWLTGKNSSRSADQKIIISVLTGNQPLVFDVRRMLVSDRAQYTTMEQDLLAFLERFLWSYEVPDDDFLFDFLYPSHIQIRFHNLQDKKRIVAYLRKIYGYALPVSDIEWGNRGSEYQVKLTLANTSDVIDVYIDMQKYLTAFFYDTDMFYNTVLALKDSLLSWVTAPNPSQRRQNIQMNASSARQALRATLDRYFSPYRVIISDEEQNSVVITAFLEEIEDLRPSEVHYRITAEKIDDKSYSIHSEWSFPQEAETAASQAGLDRQSIDLYELLNQADVYTSYNSVLHFYSSLGLPAVFQPEPKQLNNFSAKFTVHDRQAESMQFTEYPKFARIMRNLARDKICYFFPRNITKEDQQVSIAGYALLLDKSTLRGHVLKISETFQYNNGVQSRQSIIDFFPFIRQDNLLSLFAVAEPTSNRRQKITIYR